jgi:hypothetical protein
MKYRIRYNSHTKQYTAEMKKFIFWKHCWYRFHMYDFQTPVIYDTKDEAFNAIQEYKVMERNDLWSIEWSE